MATNPRRHASSRVAAEAAFISAALRALPDGALRELLCGDSDAHSWAVRWRVDAPCIVAHAKELARISSGASDVTREDMIKRVLIVGPVISAPLRDEWQSTLTALDRLSFDSLREVRYSRKGAQAGMLEDFLVLAPLSADPACEGVEDFRRRAEQHYAARQLRLRRLAASMGLSFDRARATPERVKHLGWLIRIQLKGESSRQIGRNEGIAPEAVAMAVRRLARLIDLKLRPLPVGRPHNRPKR